MIKNKHFRSYLLVTISAVILSILNVYLVMTSDVFGAPEYFAFAVLLQLVFAAVFAYSCYMALTTPRNIVASLIGSAAKGLGGDPYVLRVTSSRSPVVQFLLARLRRGIASGLASSLVVLSAGLFLLGFIAILRDVVFKESITRIDTRVINLIPSIRTSAQTHFFVAVTALANVETTVLLVILVAVLLLVAKRKLGALVFTVVALVTELGNVLLKQLVGRMRPDLALRLIKEDGFSFPSGHVMAATAIFGLLAYFLYRSTRSIVTHFIIIISYVSTVFLVALSRMYLGVHYPSDVLASALFGGFILILAVGGIEIALRYRLWGSKPERFFDRKLFYLAPAVLASAIFASPLLVPLRPVLVSRGQITIAALDGQSIKQIPKRSETLSGSPMEPINFIYIGYRDKIEQLFKDYGWYKSDPATLFNTLKALAIGFQNKQYLTAPVSPSYLAARPQDLAFQKPTNLNTLKQRHHTRLWQTDFVLADGRPIWVATASLDDGVQFVGPAKLPTHHINPNIDAERDYIVGSLMVTSNLIQVVPSELGKNAAGDPFYTDGRAVLIDLK